MVPDLEGAANTRRHAGSSPPSAATSDVNMMRPNTGTTSRFAGNATSETRPKFIAINGAVAIVAAMVPASGSRSQALTQRGILSRRRMRASHSIAHSRIGDAR